MAEAYLVDTNVLSEPMKSSCNSLVVDWLQANKELLFVSAITIEEMRYGVSRMKQGKKRVAIENFLDYLCSKMADRILPFDVSSANVCGRLRAQMRASGNNVSGIDIMLAAQARANGLRMATRNTKDFEPLGITVVNPFEG